RRNVDNVIELQHVNTIESTIFLREVRPLDRPVSMKLQHVIAHGRKVTAHKVRKVGPYISLIPRLKLKSAVAHGSDVLPRRKEVTHHQWNGNLCQDIRGGLIIIFSTQR